MPCISPIKLKNGNVVPCGRCVSCIKRLRSSMSFRLSQELKYSLTAFFITLTYDNDNIVLGDGCFTLVKQHLQLYVKRLRKYSKLRYYAIGEYGTKTDRPHYHICLFNFSGSTRLFGDLWPYGSVHIGKVEAASINYMVSDMYNFCHDIEGREPSFRCMSNKPGIGASYIERMKKYHRKGLKDYVVLPDGIKMTMPRYYKKKVFSKFELEKIAVKNRIEAWKKRKEELDELEKNPELEILRKEAKKRVFNKQSKKTKL